MRAVERVTSRFHSITYFLIKCYWFCLCTDAVEGEAVDPDPTDASNSIAAAAETGPDQVDVEEDGLLIIDEKPEPEGTESESLTATTATMSPSTTHPESGNTEPHSVDSSTTLDSDKMIIDEGKFKVSFIIISLPFSGVWSRSSMTSSQEMRKLGPRRCLDWPHDESFTGNLHRKKSKFELTVGGFELQSRA